MYNHISSQEKRPLVTIGPSGIACSKNKKETGGNNTPLQHSEWQEKEAHNSAQSSSSLSSSKDWSSQSKETVDEELNLCILSSTRLVQLQRHSPLQKSELPCWAAGINCVLQFSHREYFIGETLIKSCCNLSKEIVSPTGYPASSRFGNKSWWAANDIREPIHFFSLLLVCPAADPVDFLFNRKGVMHKLAWSATLLRLTGELEIPILCG